MIAEFLIQAWSVLLELAPFLLLGAAVAGLLHIALPPGFVHRRLRGRSGVVHAVLLGVPLPLCSCAVIPTGLGLKKDGASDGAAVAFLTATPQTGVDSILVSASFLGWPFALFKVAAAAVTGLIGGFLTDAVGGDTATAQNRSTTVVKGSTRTLRSALDHAVELLRSVWRWLVFGVVVSAAISTFLPPSAFAGFSSLGTVGAALAVLAVSIPLYVCATASVPIAAALVAGGMPVGAALVFLMAGPATNIATLGAVYRGFGIKTLAVYLSTIILGSLIGAWIFDTFLTIGATVAGHEHEHQTWWAIASALLLSAMLAWFAVRDLRRFITARIAARPAVSGEQLEIGVQGLTCMGCVRRLTATLEDTDGIESAEVSLEPGRAILRGAISEEAARSLIERAGYTPTS